MKIDALLMKVKSDFNFLLSDYSYELYKTRKEDWGFELIYKSQTVGISINFEIRECYLVVKIIKLFNGEIQNTLGEITPDTVLYSFDLDDVIKIRASDNLIPEYTGGINFNINQLNYISEKQSINLKNYCSDLLNGSFTMFDELEKVVKERARIAAFDKWGDGAIKFGWIKHQ